MSFLETVEQYAMGRFVDENLPDAAGEALMEGFDSPALRLLSVSQGDYHEQIKKIFFRSLDELKIPLPTPNSAALSMARRIANGIVKGQIEPYKGADRIWWDISSHYPDLVMLTPFVAYASEYQDHPENRDKYIQDIINYSEEFLAQTEKYDAFIAKLDSA